MAFWQTFFIILGSVLAGLGLSFAVIYVITKVKKEPMFPARKRNRMANEKASPESTTMLSSVKTKLAEQEVDNLEELLKNHKKPEGTSVKVYSAKTQNQTPKSAIFQEIESNLAIATAPWGGKLTPFQTTFGDGDYLKAEPLLANLQEEIAQVYIDVRLANSIVWLSNEVGHRSADLDESYKQLCIKIAERLIKVITSPENGK